MSALTVEIRCADPLRGAGLRAVVEAAGHRVVCEGDACDVCVADRTVACQAGSRLLLIGADDADAAGCLAAAATPAQVVAALAAVGAGLVVRDAALRPAGFGAVAETASPILTVRELEVLRAVGDGLSNKDIARRLDLSPHTVKFHLEAVFRKLDASTRAEAVLRGLTGARL